MKKSAAYEQKLLDTLKIAGRIDLSEAMRMLDVSESTVRRLFTGMAGKNGILRVHGAIQLEGLANSDYRYEQLEGIHSEEKTRIAAAAVQMISDRDVVYLDSGTTIARLSALLAARIRGEKLKVSVFTNSMVNLELLCAETDVNLIGGVYRANRRDFCGYLAEEMVRNIHFSKAFLGTDGFNGQTGFTATDFSTARLNQLVLGQTDCGLILADASKFENSAVVSYTRSRKIDLLITDTGLSEARHRELQSYCARIQTV